jgi:predicted RNase H-like nuclease
MSVRIEPLSPRTDARGSSFGVELPFGNVAECHVATVRPGAIRGNHFHTRRREVLVVMYADRWTLLWDDGEGTPVQSRAFEGSGAVVMEADPLCAHAVRNDGARDLHIISLGDTRETDTFPRRLAEPLTRIAGVDGCRAGWLAVIRDGDALETRIAVSDEELVALFSQCAAVAIDIPIGLAERGARACDVHARRFIRNRGSSVFPAPLRSFIHLHDYAEVNRLSRELQDRGVSRQAFMIYPKVAQIDRVLQRHHELRPRVYEIHPEVSFTMWNDGLPIGASKHTRDGLAERRALAQHHFGEVPPTPRGAHEDDLLDALAALWTAERIAAGRSRELGDAHVDVTGLPMRIVY